MNQLIGRSLGQYDIVGVLGEGGMATVYRAYQRSEDRHVALKVLSPMLAEEVDFQRRFRRESRTIAALSHPNVVKVYDFGQHEQVFYLAMELLTGGTLSATVRRELPAIERTTIWLDQVASALDYAHHNAVIHRDLKSSNILLDADANAYLSDFGLARILTETTIISHVGSVVGTLAYMSPEQFRDDMVDARSDIYSLGVVLFEMLTGKAPFNANRLFRMARSNRDSSVPPVRDSNPNLPASIDLVIARALARDPEDRFQSALALAAAFKDALLDTAVPDHVSPYVAFAGSPADELTPQLQWLQTSRGNIAVISHTQAAAQERDAIERLEAELRSERKSKFRAIQRRVVGVLPQDIGDRFKGRTRQQTQITKLLLEPTRLVSIYGRGGVGKTALVCKVLADLEQLDSAPDGMVFLSANGRDATDKGLSTDQIFSSFVKLLPVEAEQIVEAAWQDPEASLTRKISTLLDALRGGRYILLLDNLETLQDPESHELTDPDLRTFFEVVLEHGGLCILVTSREPLVLPRQLKTWEHVIPLDQGLSVKEAVNLLRSSDPSGRAGLRDAPASKLKIIAEKTSGFPRALEAVAGLLLDYPLYSLDDLLEDTSLFADEIAPIIVQHAISRLSPGMIQVMEALALYGQPVNQTALEFLLAPYMDSSRLKVRLNRLVQAYFINYNSAARTFALHTIDQDYCYERIPPGTPDDRAAQEGTAQYTRYALHYRAADFYRRQRKPPEQWKTIDDLAPQLAEFDQRVPAGDYDTAASLLFEFDFKYLQVWGHYNRMIALHERLQGKIVDPRLARSSANNLGYAYERVGRIAEAHNYYELALESARLHKDRRQICIMLINLGNVYSHFLGQITLAIQIYQDALTISRENGNFYESTIISNLGSAYYLLGHTERSIEYYREAVNLSRAINDRSPEALALCNLGEALTAQGDYSEATANLQASLALAEEIGNARVKALASTDLCVALMLSGDLQAAYQANSLAQQLDSSETNHTSAALNGVILARMGEQQTAARAFATAVNHAVNLLQKTPGQYEPLYTCGLAHAGLTLVADGSLESSTTYYHSALAACAAAGVIRKNLQLVDELMACPGGEHLQAVRNVLEQAIHNADNASKT